MIGKPWVKINGLERHRPMNQNGIHIPDQENGDLYRQMTECLDDYSAICNLLYFAPDELCLYDDSDITSILQTANTLGGRLVPYGIAMRIMQQNPSPFTVSGWKKLIGRDLPFRYCLLGIKPLVGPSGHSYVIELGPQHFRFKRTDDSTLLTKAYWIFAS
jgi:hypothetical protein